MLTRLLLSGTQGWYTMENVLQKTCHPDAEPERLKKLEGLVRATRSWNESLQPGQIPILKTDCTVLMTDELEKQISDTLMWMFDQFGKMSSRLNELLDNPEPLHRRPEDLSYIIACIACVYYCTNHMVHADLDFARRFDDGELAEARNGHPEESQKDLDFVEIMLGAHLRSESGNSETCSALVRVIESIMDNQIKATAVEIDDYLKILGR